MSCVTTRRRFLGCAASIVACGALPRAGAAAEPPYPVLGDGRLLPRPTSAYADAMLSGGPGKDGIPAIDEPKFWDAGRAGEYLDDGDVVFGLTANGQARAYPQRILVWHEIVNDRVAGEGLAVTYCPLTGTAIAFARGDTEFGVSGRLVNSNLIMYDRTTDTWFPQVLAIGIRGPHERAALVERPLVWTTWRRWREAHPDTAVLSTDTGFMRNYERDPYGAYNPRSGYYAPESSVMFPLMNEDRRFAPKAVVIGARTADTAVAFPLDALRREARQRLQTGGGTFTAVYDDVLDTGYVFRGATEAEPTVTGPATVSWSGGNEPQALNAFQAMWFAWAGFYPDTAVHA